ncbi:uncharacterized protein [Diadema antillarum]|uniref:uncharacterized protein isoform X1 n=2 Tax=Diadema antillarum TaxID=105358 RepID=UPI003A882918
MYAQTKQRTYFQMGMFLGTMGLILALIGLYYVNGVETETRGLATQRAVTLWGGILLICFALRNVTLGFPSSRFATESMWDMCSAIFTNLISLLISGAIVGITLWAHIDFFRSVNLDDLKDDNMLVNLVAILLCGTLAMMASLVGCIIACFPNSDAEAPMVGDQYAMDNQGFTKH